MAELDSDEADKLKQSPPVVEGKILINTLMLMTCHVRLATSAQSGRPSQHVPTTQPVSTPHNEEEPHVMVDLSKVPDGTLGKECINSVSIISFSHCR